MRFSWLVIKNLWSLTVDEAIVAEKIKKSKILKKNHHALVANWSQLKDIDLILYNLKTFYPNIFPNKFTT